MINSKYKPDLNDHDTIGLLALDKDGNLSGACTTSGLAWKYHGRVGDSPIIGAGLFVDNEVGAAAATGKGEAVIKIAGSHLIVELTNAIFLFSNFLSLRKYDPLALEIHKTYNVYIRLLRHN